VWIKVCNVNFQLSGLRKKAEPELRRVFGK